MSNNNKNNKNFEIIKENFAHGMHANISLVKIEDGRIIIWKRPISDKPEHHTAIQEEIKRSKYWRKFGVSNVKVRWHPDKSSLLKTYVEGKTLSQILENDQQFFSKIHSKPIKTLGKFVQQLIHSRHYIHNISAENVVFDGKEWQIVDSSEINKKTSLSKTKRKYEKNLLSIWSRRLNSEQDIDSLKSFLKKYC